MLDINKLVAAESMAPCDADAFLSDLDTWNEDMARQAAHEEGLELSDAHMDVICYLRDHYAECGPDANARSLLRNMEEAYIEQGGRKYLYQLFPHGPVTQGCHLAGLPTPAGNADLSFGTRH
ncbi:MAG: TusE/DsrC/DsvC family sulfur relay protein [Pseudomonadota bacterium]|nr:TusE/DsrC/DsvC family sulfur relay protein [Pseudomonadota bacterium]